MQRYFFIFLLLLVPGYASLGQESILPDTTLYGSGAGFEVVVTNSGFGLGGYYSVAVDRDNAVLAEFHLGSEKNEREVKFIGLGNTFIPDKVNYFIRVPVRLGLQRRLWADEIEDNFRPNFQLSMGPTLGWLYPYFDDDNANGVRDDGERQYDGIGSLLKGKFRLGFGGILALGAQFGENQRFTQGVRFGYSFNYFLHDIQLLEEDEQLKPQRFFGSPSISITFGRLF